MYEIKFPPLKAYENKGFLDDDMSRPVKILSEYIEPYERIKHFCITDTIVFFGSARILSPEEAESNYNDLLLSNNPKLIEEAKMKLEMSEYYRQAYLLSKRVTEWSKTVSQSKTNLIICTGGGGGIMEAANRGASAARGINIGMNINLPMEQHVNQYVTRHLAFQFNYFFMRKFWLVKQARAFIVFPGGFGTLDELFEIITLHQTGRLDEGIPIVLFGKEFWDELINFDTIFKYQMASVSDLDNILLTSDIDEALEFVKDSVQLQHGNYNNEEADPYE